MSQRITTVVDQLRAEEARIQSDVERLHHEAKAAEAQLRQVRGALAALKEKPQSKSGPTKPAATKEEVVQTMVALLQAKGPLRQGDLKRFIEQRVAAAGKSRSGLALRFREALNDPRFKCAPSGISLNATSDPPSP